LGDGSRKGKERAVFVLGDADGGTEERRSKERMAISGWTEGRGDDKGTRPYTYDTQPWTPGPSTFPSDVTSTVRWTAGKGAVSPEKKFWINAEKTSGVEPVEYLLRKHQHQESTIRERCLSTEWSSAAEPFARSKLK
jgi:hypothetical protein